MELQGLLNACFDSSENAIRVTSAFEGYFPPVGILSTIAGTPTLVTTNSVPRLSLPASGTTTVAYSFAPPKWWNFTGFGTVWETGTAGGNFRLTLAVKKLAIGADNISEAALATTTYTLAAATVGVVQYDFDRLASVDTAPDAFGSVYTVIITRLGDDAADTNTGGYEIQIPVARRNTG